MTLICVSIMVEEIDDALTRAGEAADGGARLVEWRVDQVADDRELVRRLVEDSPLPCIVTCRPVGEGGSFDGDEQQRISLFQYIGLHARPRYLDVELATYERSANIRQKVKLAIAHPDQMREMDTRLLLSVHDHDGRPADLYQCIERMAADEACAMMKVAWTARSIRDNLEAMDLLRTRAKPMIALCMGRFGLMSRILAPKFGAFLTYAALEGHDPTAPGQPTLADLTQIYRFDRIGADTSVLGVIGWPAEHSIGPRVHNALFEEIGYDGVYLPMPIPPEYEHFKASVGAMLDYEPLGFRGASVTLPHKENLLRFVGECGGRVDSSAELVGAANTLVVNDDGSLAAVNTDISAVVESACAALGLGRHDLADMEVAVLGAGGAARAAVVGFAQEGAAVVICNRTHEKAIALAEELRDRLSRSGRSSSITAEPLDRIGETGCDVLINATPVGMKGGPAPGASPVSLGEGRRPAWDSRTLVFDLVYSPRVTPLLRAAADAGCKTLNGLDMFARQAAAQIRLWTNRAIEVDEIRGIVETAIRQIETAEPSG